MLSSGELPNYRLYMGQIFYTWSLFSSPRYQLPGGTTHYIVGCQNNSLKKSLVLNHQMCYSFNSFIAETTIFINRQSNLLGMMPQWAMFYALFDEIFIYIFACLISGVLEHFCLILFSCRNESISFSISSNTFVYWQSPERDY